MGNDTLDNRNKELDKKLGNIDLNKAVSTLINDAKRSKRRVRLLAISLLFDLLLTLGLGVVSVKTHNAAVQAETNKAALLRSCQTTNEARANNAVLWDYLLALQPEKPLTPNEIKFRTEFTALKVKTFAPRDCSTIK